MRLIKSLLLRGGKRTMLEIERVMHKPARGLAYAAVGTAAAILIAVWAWDASGMAMDDRFPVQRARAW